MPTLEKEQNIAGLKEILQQSTGAILTDYRGLSVKDLTELRKKLREVDGEFHIVKNTLFKRAADGVIVDPALTGYLEGPTAIGFARKDAVAVTKALLDYAKDHKAMSVKAGVMDGKVYNADEVAAISKLPSKEILISMMLGSLNAPITSLVGTLAGITANFVYTLQAIADKKEADPTFAPSAPAASSPVEAVAAEPAPVEAVATDSAPAEAVATALAEAVAAEPAITEPIVAEPVVAEAETAPIEAVAETAPVEDVAAEPTTAEEVAEPASAEAATSEPEAAEDVTTETAATE